MKRLMQVLRQWIHCRKRPHANERYLAQSVDAHAFETRLQALERSRA